MAAIYTTALAQKFAESRLIYWLPMVSLCATALLSAVID